MKKNDEQCMGCEHRETKHTDGSKGSGHCYMFYYRMEGCKLNKNTADIKPVHAITNQGSMARLIIRKGNCDGLSCSGSIYHSTNRVPCPLTREPKGQSCGWADNNYQKMVLLASDWIVDHEQIEEPVGKQTEEAKSTVSEESQVPVSNAKSPNDKCDKKQMSEIDILIHIIKKGSCIGIHCDGVDVEPWVQNIGTLCPLQEGHEKNCPIYKHRNKQCDNMEMVDDQNGMLRLAKEELTKLANIKIDKDVLGFIHKHGCSNISCTGIVDDDPTDNYIVNDGVDCPLYDDCPIVNFGVDTDDPSIKQMAYRAALSNTKKEGE